MKTTIILSVLLLSGCAAPKPATWLDGLSDQQKAMCQSQGGCRVVTTNWLNLKVIEVASALAEEAAAEIASKMCERKSL